MSTARLCARGCGLFGGVDVLYFVFVNRHASDLNPPLKKNRRLFVAVRLLRPGIPSYTQLDEAQRVSPSTIQGSSGKLKKVCDSRAAHSKLKSALRVGFGYIT